MIGTIASCGGSVREMCLRAGKSPASAGNFGGLGVHRWSDSQQKLPIGSVNTNTIPFYKENIHNNNK